MSAPKINISKLFFLTNSVKPDTSKGTEDLPFRDIGISATELISNSNLDRNPIINYTTYLFKNLPRTYVARYL